MKPDVTLDASLDRQSDRHPLRWLLLTGSRRSITLLLSALILASLLTVGTVWELEMETLVNETRAVQSLFNTLLGGIILFVSVVLSINTAVLSQEFGPLTTKRTQIEEAIEFQTELEAFVESGVSPAALDEFFLFILDGLRAGAAELERRAEALEDAESSAAVSAFAADVEAEVGRVERRLRSENRRVSSVLLAGLDYESGRHIHRARRILTEHQAGLGESDRALLSDLISILMLFTSGREYFTTLYFKREVRNLSSSLLVLALPVIVFTSYVLLAIDAGLFPTATVLGIQPRLLYVSVAFVIALSPYVLLSAYMLRVVTVSRYSLGASGFTHGLVRSD